MPPKVLPVFSCLDFTRVYWQFIVYFNKTGHIKRMGEPGKADAEMRCLQASLRPTPFVKTTIFQSIHDVLLILLFCEGFSYVLISFSWRPTMMISFTMLLNTSPVTTKERCSCGLVRIRHVRVGEGKAAFSPSLSTTIISPAPNMKVISYRYNVNMMFQYDTYDTLWTYQKCKRKPANIFSAKSPHI